MECVVIFPSLTNLPSFNHHPSFFMPGHSLCDSDVLQIADQQTSWEGRPSWLTTSTGRPCQVLTPGLIHHLSDISLTGLSPPPPVTDHWPVWFVCDSCLHPISSVRWYDFGPLRVVSGGLFVGPFFLCDLTPVVLINVRSSVTCTSLIYILWHVANLLLSFYLRINLP